MTITEFAVTIILGLSLLLALSLLADKPSAIDNPFSSQEDY